MACGFLVKLNVVLAWGKVPLQFNVETAMAWWGCLHLSLAG